MTVVVTFAVVTNMTNSSTYERVNLSSTCSLELPKIDFTESNSNANGGNSYVQVNTDYKQLSSNDLIIGYMKMENSLGIYGNSSFNMADQFKAGHTDWYSRIVSNDATGETVLVMGKDKEQVDRIANSIKFTDTNDNPVNSTNMDSNKNTGNNKTPYAYADDGTPIWTEAEFERYVMDKGGYSSLEDYYNTQKQNPNYNYNPSPTPDPTPAPSPAPTPSNRTAKWVK